MTSNDPEIESKNKNELVKLSNTWTIRNYSKGIGLPKGSLTSSRLRGPDEISCRIFSGNYVKWQIQLQQAIVDERPALSIYLKMCDSLSIQRVPTRYKFSLLDARRQEVMLRECEYIFAVGEIHGFTDFVRKETLLLAKDTLLLDDCLTIYCEIDAREDCALLPVPRSELVDNLDHLFETKVCSDVTLNVAGKELQAHKAILAARSPVFRKMFCNDMKESNMNRVEIIDLESDVVEAMLKYMYTDGHSFEKILVRDLGGPSERQNIAIGLLRAADKYQLDRLRSICEQELCNHLSENTVIAILLSADQYNAARLKHRAIEFIGANRMKKIDWTNIAKERADLAIQIMDDVVSHICGPKSSRRRFTDVS